MHIFSLFQVSSFKKFLFFHLSNLNVEGDRAGAAFMVFNFFVCLSSLLSLPLMLCQIPVFMRTNQHFRPPTDLSQPLIMIGPGTGVAPFIGFLEERSLLRKDMEKAEGVDNKYGETWLYFGCRNKEKDFLFRYYICYVTLTSHRPLRKIQVMLVDYKPLLLLSPSGESFIVLTIMVFQVQ